MIIGVLVVCAVVFILNSVTAIIHHASDIAEQAEKALKARASEEPKKLTGNIHFRKKVPDGKGKRF
jgi:hypothetical protein